jgi:hypothetical protein
VTTRSRRHDEARDHDRPGLSLLGQIASEISAGDRADPVSGQNAAGLEQGELEMPRQIDVQEDEDHESGPVDEIRRGEEPGAAGQPSMSLCTARKILWPDSGYSTTLRPPPT